jgi:hypothetical protein
MTGMRNSIGEKAHSANKDCCNPVPEITTSQGVSLRDSMIEQKLENLLLGNFSS